LTIVSISNYYYHAVILIIIVTIIIILKDAEIGFSTGSRAPLSAPTAGPGPGAYDIKTTLGKIMESNIKSPCQFTLRGREKFGDPNERALSKTFANEPG
jgi:hypothetical protein